MTEIKTEKTNGGTLGKTAIQSLFKQFVVPSYGRFDLSISRGSGSRVWDHDGKCYLDMGGGIAVCCLGHSHPEITEALIEQSRKLVHVSNLYYTEPQALLAQQLVSEIAPGKVFFANSGAEANEGLYKLARKFGHDEGRFEILTAQNSFHGRTLAGIAATGQEKVKKGFEPMVQGFRHVPYNNLQAIQDAISPATVAILIEGVQGEGGITPATSDYLLGLRRLCNEKNLLLLMDGVQCGHFRTGRFQSFQRILEGVPGGESFLPDGFSMAKSLGGGFPIGGFWVRQPYADLLSPGTHATTFGGTPLACAVALKVLEVIRRDNLAQQARLTGDLIMTELMKLQTNYPAIIKGARGLGLIIGLELYPKDRIPALAAKESPTSLQAVNQLHNAGLLTIPSGNQVIRLLPAYNIQKDEVLEAIGIIETMISRWNG